MSEVRLIPCSKDRGEGVPEKKGPSKVIVLGSRPGTGSRKSNRPVDVPAGQNCSSAAEPGAADVAMAPLLQSGGEWRAAASVGRGWGHARRLIAGAVLVGGLIAIGSSAVPKPASIKEGASASDICAALRPFGVTDTAGAADAAGNRSYGCSMGPGGDDPARPQRLSIAVTSFPGAAKLLRSVEIEGQYRQHRLETRISQEMLWAASSVFTRLGTEVPLAVSDGIDHPSVSGFRSGNFNVRMTHVCDDAQRGPNALCRMSLSVRSVS